MTNRVKILNILNEMEDYKVIELWNEYCRDNGYEEILPYDDYYLDEYLYGMKPHEIFDMVKNGTLFDGAEYFKIDDCSRFKCMTRKDVFEEIEKDYLAEMIEYDLNYYSRQYSEFEELEEEEPEFIELVPGKED